MVEVMMDTLKFQVLIQNLIPTQRPGKPVNRPAGYKRHPLSFPGNPLDPGAHQVPVMPPDRHRRPAVYSLDYICLPR
ncbi:hypothetical protein PAMP_014285 [Pampus punctatissimus]